MPTTARTKPVVFAIRAEHTATTISITLQNFISRELLALTTLDIRALPMKYVGVITLFNAPESFTNKSFKIMNNWPMAINLFMKAVKRLI